MENDFELSSRALLVVTMLTVLILCLDFGKSWYNQQETRFRGFWIRFVS